VQISYTEFHKIRPEDMTNTDIHSVTPLSAAFLTASIFRNSHSTFWWTPPTPNFIQNEGKCRNCGGGGGDNLRPYVKNGFHGTKFHGTQVLNGTRWGSPISDLNELLKKMWQIRHKVEC